MPKRILSSKPVTISELRELLLKQTSNLTPLQSRVLNYVSTFTKLSPERAKRLKEELVEKFGLLSEEACQIVNICPTRIEELRTILSGYKRLISTVLFSDEKLNEILEVVKKHLEEDKQKQNR